MATRKLSRLGVDPKIVDALARHNIHTCKDVLDCSEYDLVELADQPLSRVRALLSAAVASVAPPSITAQDMLSRERTRMCTSLPLLDKALHGGIRTGSITELVGPPGAGKTQFCTMLAVQASRDVRVGGMGLPAVYIDTEGSFSAQRMVDLARARYPHEMADVDALTSLTAAITILTPATCKELSACLQSLEERLIRQPCGLVVVDSMASLARKEYDVTSNRQRTDFLSVCAAVLKRIAHEFNVPVVVTNQVTSRFEGDDEGGAKAEGVAVAALGNTWAHSINTRLKIEFDETSGTRLLHVAKSPLCAPSSHAFIIDESGPVLCVGRTTDSHADGGDRGAAPMATRSSFPLSFGHLGQQHHNIPK